MTKDAARKRAARQRAETTGESYTRAARLEAADRKPAKVADMPPIQLPAPVALMIARHVRAAEMHIGTGRRIAEDYGVPIERRRSYDSSPGPLADAVDRIWEGLHQFHQWADRTAVASGVVPVEPGYFQQTEQQKAAERTLYPGDDQWCHAPGKTMPQPGEHPERTPAVSPVRYSLPGPVRDKRLVAHSQGLSVEKARHVVPGTPAALVWEAHGNLNAYNCQWRERGGDSPGDLAAAADGLTELADELASAASSILTEVERRAEDGSLTGVDRDRLAATRAQVAALLFKPGEEGYGAHNEVSSAMSALRGVLAGTAPALPPPNGQRVPALLARSMAGKTVAELRAELGSEMFLQRQRSKTRMPEYARAEALQRMIQWCHATGRDTYDPAAHRASDPDAQ